MKKFLLVVTLFASSMLCAQEKVTIWTSSEHVKNAIIKSMRDFKKEYGAEAEITVLNKDLTSQFKTAALAKKGPDILVWAHDVVGDLAESGLIEPIKLSRNLRKAFLPVALEAFTYKGKIYGYPYDLEAVALIYNKKLVKKAPGSMEELVNIAKKINNSGNYGFLFDYRNFFFSFAFISAGGGYIFKNNNDQLDVTDIGLANEGSIAGATFLLSLVDQKIIPESTDRSIAFNKMKAGTLAMTIDGPWAINDLKKNNIEYGISPIPSLQGNIPRPFVGTHGFIIRRSSPNKELAKEFIENYLVTKEGILSLYNEDPRGPSRFDVINEIKKTNKDLAQFLKSAQIGIPMPNVPEMSAIWGAAGGALGLISSHQASPKNALIQAKRQIMESLKK